VLGVCPLVLRVCVCVCVCVCRFSALQSFNGAAFSAEEIAAAGRLLGVMEGALDAALVSKKKIPPSCSPLPFTPAPSVTEL
jgi:hypothetical protein